MSRLLPLCLLLAACSPTTHGPHLRQAVSPAPVYVAPPPVHTPGFYPGTPPPPTYTPAGAGLPGERVPATEAPAVPRSPNKRILPPTKEPGLWAADGAPDVLAGNINLFGVDIPIPSDMDAKARKISADCAVDMALALAHASEQRVTTFPPQARACIAARALEYCTDTRRKEHEQSGQDVAAHRKIDAYAKALAKEWCTERLNDEEDAALKRLQEKWGWVTQGMKP